MYIGILCCNQNTLVYEDLDCKPQFSIENSICPIGYDCSSFDNRPNDKCHFKGHFINVGEDLPEELLKSSCYAACRCMEYSGK